jgi:DDE superfamily endonuclease
MNTSQWQRLHIFGPFEPSAVICVNKRRMKIDYANFMKILADHYPDAETILLIQDNLNTHTIGSFYEAIPPVDAFKLAKRFEDHYTPKKGSCLIMAEIELAALSKQCLDRRIADMNKLAHEVSVWEKESNAIANGIYLKIFT